MKIRSSHFLLLIAFSLFLCLSNLNAQAGRGKARLAGTVIDEKGNPVASASVVLELVREKAVQRETTSNKKGEWTFIGLGSGDWRIIVTAGGYTQTVKNTFVSQIELNPKVVLVLKKALPTEEFFVQDQSTLVLIDQSQQLFNEKKYDEALSLLGEFLEKNPTVYQTHILIGDCYREKGELDKAIETYNLAIEKAKSDEKKGKEVMAKALAAIGDCYVRKGDIETAQNFFKQSLATSPDNEMLAYNVAEFYFSNQNPEEAVEYYTIATQIKPDWPLPYYKLGLVNLNKTDYEKAKEHFKKFLELEPDSETAATVKNILSYLETIKK